MLTLKTILQKKERKKPNKNKLLSWYAWTFAGGAELSQPWAQALPWSKAGVCTHMQLCTGTLSLATSAMQYVGWSDMPAEVLVLWDCTLAVEWVDKHLWRTLIFRVPHQAWAPGLHCGYLGTYFCWLLLFLICHPILLGSASTHPDLCVWVHSRGLDLTQCWTVSSRLECSLGLSSISEGRSHGEGADGT